jgi:signal transduction histidine kinase
LLKKWPNYCSLLRMEASTSLEKHLGINSDIEAIIHKIILILGCLTLAIGVSVIFGWIAEIDVLKRALTDRVSMKANTAIGFILMGVALVFMSLTKRKLLTSKYYMIARLCAGLAGLIGFFTGIEFIFGLDFHIDQLIFNEDSMASSIIPGRMSPTSALCFVLLGSTLALQGRSKKNESLAQILCFLSLLISYGIIIGYVLGSAQLYGNARLNTMAIHTAVAFFMVSVAGILYYHDHRYIAILLSPTPAGYTSRRLLPIIFIGPIVFAWLKWTFLSDDWLQGKLMTALFAAVATGFTSLIANKLAWKMHEQYSLMKELDIQFIKNKELLLWRENIVTTLIHDLRTPMFTARIAAELFTRQQNFSKDRLHELGRKMTMAIDRSDQLLRDVLDSTTAMAGTSPHLVLTQCHLKTTLKKALSYLPQYDTRIALFCSEEIYGQWNEDALIRIIENLVTNAIKYGDRKRPVSIKAREEDKIVSIEVHNWGNEIPSDEQEGLFKLFTRSSKVIHPGWGIGLVTVKALSESLGGLIFVDSSKEQGTSFTVKLPVHALIPVPPFGITPENEKQNSSLH